MAHLKLSRAILDMKFMKKTRERVDKEDEDAEGKAMYSSEMTEQMTRSGNLIFAETGIFNCLGLIEGRLSFGGMNPDIEKMMEDENAKKLDEVEKRREKDVSDMEMAQNYSTLSDTLASKFNPKKSRNKMKFIKPDEDDV